MYLQLTKDDLQKKITWYEQWYCAVSLLGFKAQPAQKQSCISIKKELKSNTQLQL